MRTKNGFLSPPAESAPQRPLPVRSSHTAKRGTVKPELTVITAAHPGSYQWLPRAASSLSTQRTPLRWIVVADDEDSSQAQAALACAPEAVRRSMTVMATGRRACGAAVARGIALIEVSTPWIANLDSDDCWLPGGVDFLLGSCLRHGASWAVGHTINETPEGLVPRPKLAPRTLRPGEFLEQAATVPLPWAQPGLVAKTSAVIKLGGWPALPFAEDTALTTALIATTTGRIESETVYQYQKWPGQTSSDVDWSYVEHWHGIAVARAHRIAEHIGVLDA